MKRYHFLMIINVGTWLIYWYWFWFLFKAHFPYSERNRNEIKHSIIRKTFTGLLKYLLFGFIYSLFSSGETDQAGGGGEKGWSDKFSYKCGVFYDKTFPRNPNIVINIILWVMVLSAIPIFFNWIEVTFGLKSIIYTNAIGAILTSTKVPVIICSIIINPLVSAVLFILEILKKLISILFSFLGNILDRIGDYLMGIMSGAVFGFTIQYFSGSIFIARWGWIVIGIICSTSFWVSFSSNKYERAETQSRVFRYLFWVSLGTMVGTICSSIFHLTKNANNIDQISFLVLGGAIGLLVGYKKDLSIMKAFCDLRSPHILFYERNIKGLFILATTSESGTEIREAIEFLAKLDNEKSHQKLGILLKSKIQSTRELSASNLLTIQKCKGISTIKSTLTKIKFNDNSFYPIVKTLLNEFIRLGPNKCNIQLFSFILNLNKSDTYRDFIIQALFRDIDPEFNLIFKDAKDSAKLQKLILITSQYLNGKKNFSGLRSYLTRKKLDSNTISLIKLISKNTDEQTNNAITDCIKNSHGFRLKLN